MSVSFGSSKNLHGYPYLANESAESSMNVVQLPSFKLTAQQEANSNVEVIVEDINGQVIKPDIKSKEGVYNSTFLPKTPGDYVVSIRVDNEDIEGSPFLVKVFDPSLIKVIGLKAAIVSSLNVFSVSTEGIGEGPLAITIINLTNNEVLPAKLAQDTDNTNLFHIQWMPEQAGFVKIHINYAGVEAMGSPYQVEVIDPILTSIEGPGLEGLVPINSKACFNVKTPSKMVVFDQLKAEIVDPTGNRVEAGVVDKGSGCVAVEFIPYIVGPHKLEVAYFGKSIKNSPFTIKAYDASRVRVLNWKSSGQVEQTIDFDVDISKAGPGDFNINISGGETPYKIKEKELGKYKVTYTPLKPGVLEFNFSFNKKKIQGGPWTCTIQSPPTASVTGNGVQTFPALPINSPTTFQVKLTGTISGDLDIHVIDPNGQSVQSDMLSYPNLAYTYQYTPRAVGTYNIEVSMEGQMVPGSPFQSKAYSPGSVILGDVHTGIVGRTVEFNVDTSQAGDGTLEVLIEKGGVTNVINAGDIKGANTVSFVPKIAKVHSIEVKFNGQVVKGSPLSVNILDLSKVTLSGRGDGIKVPVNKPCNLRLNITGAGTGTYTALARAPSGAEISMGVRESSQKFLELDYTPREVGVHAIEVELEGFPLPLNPIDVSAYDISKIRVREIKDGVVNQQAKILVESGDPGEGDLIFSVYGPGGQQLNNNIEQNSSSTYSILFTPLQQGPHQFSASFNNENVIGSPFNFNVYNIANVSATGKSLKTFPCGKMTNFFISSPDNLRAVNCLVKIIDPNLHNIGSRLYDISDGSVKVEFLGTTPGDYRIDVKCHGETINGSPFTTKGWDISKVSVTPVHTAVVAVQSAFNISVKEAGEGTLEIGITNPSGQQITNNVNPLGPGQFVVSFTPSVQGSHQANITFNDESVNGSPFTIEVNDPRKAVARGEGLELVRCNKPATFSISAPGVGVNDLNVNITGPKNSNVRFRLSEQSVGQFRVDYTPIITGDHLIEIEVFEKAIPGSAFIAKCWDNQKVSCTKILSAKVGIQTSFNLDASLAGEGDIEIVIHGSSGGSISNTVTPLGPGLFMVSFVPIESGTHKASINFNHENVIGSPFNFNVIDLSRATARGEGLGLVKVNNTAPFVITAPGASQSDVEVYIYAPNGKETSFRMTEHSNDSFRVDYTPTVPGDHRIEVSYFGQSLPGSPFFTRVWDPSKVFVTGIRNSKVGYNNSFTLDVNEAGEGTLEIGVTNPSGQNIHNNVAPCGPGKFEVTSVPEEAGKFKVVVTFNKENVPGSPFFFLATDVTKVTARGDGVGSVKCGVNTSFVVFAPAAQQKDLEIVVSDPENNELMTRVSESNTNNFRVEYTPRITGTHHVSLTYFGQLVPSHPMPVEVWDSYRAQLNMPSICKVNQKVSVKVDTSKAGKGLMEAEVTHTNGRSLPCSINSISNTVYEVVFTPVEAGQHRLIFLMNKEQISGSPSSFLAIDPARSGLRGHGMCEVPCNKIASFNFTAPAASDNDIHVKITAPDYRDVPFRMMENMDVYEVEYTPIKPGSYTIEVTYFGEMLSGCPFKCMAFDASLVQLTPIKHAFVGKDASFNVNTVNAGKGVLDVQITADGQHIRSQIKNGNEGIYNVSFSPVQSCIHDVNVKFNTHNVPGSSFKVQVVDGSLATASGSGLEMAKVGGKGVFEVKTNNPPIPLSAVNVQVTIISSRGQTVPCKITSSGSTSYNVEYTPKESGIHKVEIMFAGQSIQGAPFIVQVCDPTLARIRHQKQGVVGKKYFFDVDTTKCCGEMGEMEVEVTGRSTYPATHITSSKGIYRVSFVATEVASHSVEVTYFGEIIPESPFFVNFIDTETMSVQWQDLDLIPQDKLAMFELQMGRENVSALSVQSRTEETTVQCRIRDPNKKDVTCRISKTSRAYQVTFTPLMVGPHRIELNFGNKMIDGSPYTCQVYNVANVRIVESTSLNCVGMESSFGVDRSEAGVGELSVDVLCGSVQVPTQTLSMYDNITKYVFNPISPQVHRAIVKFNSETVSGSPLLFNVSDPSSSVKLVSENRDGVAGTMFNATLVSTTTALKIDSVSVDARGPEGEVVITTKSHSLDGSIKINLPGTSAGQYTLGVNYCDRPVMGSPLKFDVVDASMVNAQVPDNGVVGETTSFEVKVMGAGEAELNVKVYDNEGVLLMSNTRKETNGYRISYVPVVGGYHRIHVSYGGVEINASPFQQHVTDTFLPSASGQGLVTVKEHERTSFSVNTDGRSGCVEVKIQGPKGEVTSKVDQLGNDGPTLVSYTPTEPGLHNISVLWDEKHIKGSPFQVNVECSEKIEVEGGWETVLDAFGRIPLVVNERKTFNLDCRSAGSGPLQVMLNGPHGSIPAEVVELPHGMTQVGFIPPYEGDYSVNMCCNNRKMDLTGTAVRLWMPNVPCPQAPPQAPSQPPREPTPPPPREPTPPPPREPTPPPLQPIPLPQPKQSPYVLGEGLYFGTVCSRSEFTVVAHDAEARVTASMIGVESDVAVNISNLFDQHGTFKCTYSPQTPGFYLLTISCDGQQVRGSPFKVRVAACEEAPVPVPPRGPCIITAIGYGLSTAKINNETEFLLEGVCNEIAPVVRMWSNHDEVAVRLSKIAEGKYRCFYTPRSAGLYQLSVEHALCSVPESPFRVEVSCDDNIIVTGPGLHHTTCHQHSEFFINQALSTPIVQMTGPNEQHNAVYVQVNKMNESSYMCSYQVTQPGEYHIRVIGSCGEVANSPFCVVAVPELSIPVDPSKILLTGSGLTTALCCVSAQFEIDCSQTNIKGIFPMVKIMGAEEEIECVVSKVADEKYSVIYEPKKTGVLFISITYGEYAVKDSPYKLNVAPSGKCQEQVCPVEVVHHMDFVCQHEICCDLNHYAVAFGCGLMEGEVECPCNFIIDTTQAGPGKPAVKVTYRDMKVPCEIMQVAKNIFKCTYVPTYPGEYIVSIKYAGVLQPGAPYRVMIHARPPHAMMVVTGPGLSIATLDKRSEFLLDGFNDGEFMLDLMCCNTPVPIEIVKVDVDKFLCSYISTCTGDHSLSVLHCEEHIAGSPFQIKVLEKVTIQPLPPSCTQECACETKVCDCQENHFHLHHPPMPYHKFDLTSYHMETNINHFYEQEQHQRQIVPPTIPVIHTLPPPDLSHLLPPAFACGQGLSMGMIHSPSEFMIENAPDIPEIELVSSESDVMVRCFKVDDYKYRCFYVPTMPGFYMLYISIRGVQINDSPFKVIIHLQPEAYLSEPDSHMFDEHVHYNDHHHHESMQMAAMDLFTNANEGNVISIQKTSIFSKAYAQGEGIGSAQLNQPTEFFINDSESEPMGKLYGVEHDVQVVFQKVDHNTYKGSYTITKPGMYMLTIVCDGVLVAGSPFKIQVKGLLRASHAEIYRKGSNKEPPQVTVTASANTNPLTTAPENLMTMSQSDHVAGRVVVTGSGLAGAVVSQQSQFIADVSNAGEGYLAAKLVGIATTVDVFCQPMGDGLYNCSYSPKQQGAYLLNVTWSDKPVPGSPFKINVTSSVNPSMVKLLGEYENAGAVTGNAVTVMVDARAAGKEMLQATCRAPSRFVSCEIAEVSDGLFNVTFVPEEAGVHELNITYSNASVPGCPMAIRVAGLIDPSKVVVSGEGLKGGVLAHFKSDFSLDTRGAGPGQLTCRMRGKKGTFKIEMTRDPTQNRLIHCRFDPTEVGVYVLETKWSGQHVPGSPFSIHLVDTLQELGNNTAYPGASVETLTGDSSAFFD